MQDQAAIQITKKAKALGRSIGNSLIVGTNNHTVNDPAGLQFYCNSSQTRTPVSSAGDVFSLSIMDQLAFQYLKIRNDAVFVMPSALYVKFTAALRSAGGIQLVDYQGVKRPWYAGYPVLRNDFIPTTEVVGPTSTCSSIYMVSFDEVQGAYLAANEKTPLPGGDTMAAEGMFELINVGQDPTTDNQKYRLGTNFNLVIKSPLAVCRASGIQTV